MDYVSPGASQLFIFGSGQTFVETSLTTCGNTDTDGNRDLQATIETQDDTDLEGTANATVTILDDDGPATLQFALASSTSPEGSNNLQIPITRAGGTGATVGVSCTITPVAPATGADYNATSPQVLSFGPGETTKNCVIASLVSDAITEATDAVLLTLSLPTGPAGTALGAQTTHTLTISDASSGVFDYTSSNFNVTEGAGPASLQVTRTGGTAGTVTLNCNVTAGGTATNPSDYEDNSVSVTFGPGETTDSCIFPIENDSISETTETVLFGLSIVTGTASISGQTTTTLTVYDDDGIGTFSLSSATYAGTEGAANNVIVTVNRLSTTGSASVDYATSNGTAVAGLDYTSTSGTLNFVNGEASKTVTIPIINDINPEGAETFTFALSNPSAGATLGSPASAVITIGDNDGGVTVTGLVPASGPPAGGNPVVITGTGFEFSCSVTFGGVTASRLSGSTVSSTQMTYVAPEHNIGTVDVVVTCGVVSSPDSAADNYTYTAGPTITSLTPSSGPGTGNTSVTITGTNFVNVTDVNFGSVDAIDYVVTSSTTISAIAPPGAAGVVRVSVTSTGGTSPDTSADDYTYTSTGSIPVITSISPSSTPINTSGTSVTITGTNLLGATSVTFGGVAGTIQSVSNTQIVVTAPSRATTGTVEVVVTVPSVGSNTTTGSQNDFTYGTPPGSTQTVTLYVRWTLLAWQGPTMNALAALQGNDSNPQMNDVSGIVTAIYWWNAAGTGCPTGQTQCWFAFFPDGVNIPGANDFSQLVHDEAYWFANGTSAATQWIYPKQ
ncbi:MAG: IPT/TIG domain-containing protein [Dehalococcoidia bacterium]|nr:IPT/TIG domain-containing protein [Dehalococcoidia bacterium]